jgi:CheY-like chemotaxis protein
VLLVEDNPADADLVLERLGEQLGPGCEVAHVCRLGDAVDSVLRGAYDVVLLDLGLPDSCGIAGVRRLRRCAPGVPIVVLSGDERESIREGALHGGARDVLSKRVPHELLFQSVLSAVAEVRAGQIDA